VKTFVVCGRLRAVFCLRLPVRDYVRLVNRYAQRLGRLRRLRSSQVEGQVSGFSLGFLVECSRRGYKLAHFRADFDAEELAFF
jgi:hypothetical protein